MSIAKTLLSAAAVTLALAACEENKTGAGTTSSTTSSAQPHQTQESPATPTAASNPNTGVTNTNAMVAADPLATVENKGRVKEYPDQVKISPPKQALLITGFSADVRDSPSGEMTGTIESATENVLEVARDASGSYFLVVYPSPSDHSKTLAGWVYKDALENTGWSLQAQAKRETFAAAAGKLGCSMTQSHLRTDHDFCGRKCRDDKACNKNGGEVCDGLAYEVHESSNELSGVRYCIAPPTTNNNK